MISLFLANVWGWIWAHRRTVAILAAILLIAILSVLFGRGCNSKPAKLNQEEIIKAQQSIAVEDRKQMVDILASSDAREAAIDSNISNAKANTVNAIHESRERWSQASDDELKAELLRRMNQ